MTGQTSLHWHAIGVHAAQWAASWQLHTAPLLRAISDFRRGVNTFVLQGYYTALNASYRRFGTTYRSHLRGFSSPAWPLKMEPTECLEPQLTNYQWTLRNISEERTYKYCSRYWKLLSCQLQSGLITGVANVFSASGWKGSPLPEIRNLNHLLDFLILGSEI